MLEFYRVEKNSYRMMSQVDVSNIKRQSDNLLQHTNKKENILDSWFCELHERCSGEIGVVNFEYERILTYNNNDLSSTVVAN